MPETGYNETYDQQSNVIESEEFIITDDQLLLRELTGNANSYHTQALRAYKNWGILTMSEKDRILKFLVGYYLASGQQLGFFSIE